MLKGFMKSCNTPPGQSHSYNIKKWACRNEHIRPILPRCYKGERAPPGDVSNPITLNIFSADSTCNGKEWEKLIKMDIAVLFFHKHSIHWPVTHTLADLKDTSCKGTVSNSTFFTVPANAIILTTWSSWILWLRICCCSCVRWSWGRLAEIRNKQKGAKTPQASVQL